jgi:hypothetical protein
LRHFHSVEAEKGRGVKHCLHGTLVSGAALVEYYLLLY